MTKCLLRFEEVPRCVCFVPWQCSSAPPSRQCDKVPCRMTSRVGATHPSQASAACLTPDLVVQRGVGPDEGAYALQCDDAVARQRHLHVTEALHRQLRDSCFALVGQLASPDQAHAPDVQQVLNLMLGQIQHCLQGHLYFIEISLSSEKDPALNCCGQLTAVSDLSFCNAMRRCCNALAIAQRARSLGVAK